MRIASLVPGLVLVFLAGCSSLPRDSGYEVREARLETTQERQEPWQNISLKREVFTPDGVAAVYVKLTPVAAAKWQKEFTDPARTYEVRVGGLPVKKTLERSVFRAITYSGTVPIGMYDAVRDPKGQGFMVFVPRTEAKAILGQNLFIPSSDGKWGTTARGELVTFGKDFGLHQLPASFFTDHPSSVTQVITLDPKNNEHARMVLDSIAQSFPVAFWLRGKSTPYLGRPHVDIVLAEFTSLENAADKLISCTSLKLGPTSASALPFMGAMYGIQAGIALTKDDCLK